MQDNLPELRDIHLPDGVSFFPLAYGWWIILAVILTSFFLYKVLSTIRKKSKKLYAIRLISKIDTNNIITAAISVSEILRRICVYKYNEANSLFGKDWITFLNKHSKHKIDNKVAELLISAPYINPQKNNFDIKDINDLITFSKRWIGENL